MEDHSEGAQAAEQGMRIITMGLGTEKGDYS
jgi:hypothetical protein